MLQRPEGGVSYWPGEREADAWATALMVQGPQAGGELAARLSLDALFLMREAGGIRTHAVGALFDSPMVSAAGREGLDCA